MYTYSYLNFPPKKKLSRYAFKILFFRINQCHSPPPSQFKSRKAVNLSLIFFPQVREQKTTTSSNFSTEFKSETVTNFGIMNANSFYKLEKIL